MTEIEKALFGDHEAVLGVEETKQRCITRVESGGLDALIVTGVDQCVQASMKPASPGTPGRR